MKLKQWTKDLLLSITITLALFEGLCLISWRYQELDRQMIEQEIKKTEMSGTQISQNEILQK